MFEKSNLRDYYSPTSFSKNWQAIERCLEVATKAEQLRAQSLALRETSRLLREEALRITRAFSSNLPQ